MAGVLGPILASSAASQSQNLRRAHQIRLQQHVQAHFLLGGLHKP